MGCLHAGDLAQSAAIDRQAAVGDISAHAFEPLPDVIPSLLVAAGGALGSVARYWATVLVAQALGERFPWATVGINVLGSFAIGLFAGLTAPGGAVAASNEARLFFTVGVCGGFTTFSSFSLQTVSLARGGNWPAAAANVLLSVAACLLAVTFGHLLAVRHAPGLRTF